MRSLSAALLLVVALGVTVAGTGCRSEPATDSPESVAQAFADAMAEGDTADAAALWNYVTDARKSNPDWDDIPSGQRGQIVGKLKESKKGELESQTGYFAGEMKAGAPNVSGTSATVEVRGGAQGAVIVRLAEADGKWGVVGFAPATTQ